MINKKIQTDNLIDGWQPQFNAWMKQVDAALVALCGLDSGCLPDFAYADAFNNRDTAKATAREAYKAASEF